MFACASLIKEIGRGKEGARSLSADQAQALYAAMLAGEVSDIELGAVLIALRVKGESAQELIGFCRAAQSLMPSLASPCTHSSGFATRDASVAASSLPALVFPSYNGARRRPNLLPLLAGALARLGYPVLIHGHLEDPTGRITSAQVFEHLRWPRYAGVERGADGSSALSKAFTDAHKQRWPLFVATEHLHPGLVSLLDKRRVLGVRNATHTIVKLLQPVVASSAILITSYTHPEFFHLQREVLSALGITALVIRGHEGEAVAHPQKTPRMDGVCDGETWCVDEGDPTFVDMPERNPDRDAQHTAEQALELLVRMDSEGVSALPPGLQRQIKAIEAVTHKMRERVGVEPEASDASGGDCGDAIGRGQTDSDANALQRPTPEH